MKQLIEEGFNKLDLTTVDGFKIAAVAETTAYKILRIVAAKKNKSGDGKLIKSSTKQPPTSTQKPQTTSKTFFT